MIRIVLTILLAITLPNIAFSQNNGPKPDIRTYKTIDKAGLKAHIFMPANSGKEKLHAAIILFHGGGWSAGSPEWTYYDAQHYAELGMVAVAGEYRLSDQKSVTPLEAMADARDLIRWLRQNATEFSVDPHRIAMYGVSAGGHLATSAAIFPHDEESKISAVPDALVLLTPAVSLVNDHWPQILLGARAQTKDISPAENISKLLPPTIIVEGDADTETPLRWAQLFCDRAKQVGGTCELDVYPHVGHLLSRNLDPHAQEEGPFDIDPQASGDAHAKEDAFLEHLGFIKNKP